MSDKQLCTRYAPSPTGFLHLGGLRTALYNWLFARANNGRFLLRIEDTDRVRHQEASVEQILEAMHWIGMDWDEEPVFQSQRGDLYRNYLDKLIELDMVYPAFETMEELDAMRQKAMAEKRPAVYDRSALKLSKDEAQAKIEAGVPYVLRFKTPESDETKVPDLLMGGEDCRFANNQIGDFAITRPGTVDEPLQPLYNFVVTVDDALMGISHVIRGVEHLGNAARQTLLYQAWGFDVPQFLHLPLIMKGGKKMSKRDEDADPRYPVSVTARRQLGYLPEATANYIALLGWTAPDEKELFELEELIQAFSLERFSKSNANFDEDKFLHINGWHIRNIENDDLVSRIKPFLTEVGFAADADWLPQAVSLVKERCSLLADFSDALAYFYTAPSEYEEKGVNKFFKTEISDTVLATVAGRLAKADDFTATALEALLHQTVEDMELKFGKFGPVIRLALTGRMQSPGLAEVMEILGREESIKRLEAARDYIKTHQLSTAA
ncbi:MAG: glutamate--tRNA ligase [Pseudomonadota bacterium]